MKEKRISNLKLPTIIGIVIVGVILIILGGYFILRNNDKNEISEKALYNKIVEDKSLLQYMVLIKDFNKANFQDEEIVKLLPLLAHNKFTYDDDSIAKSSVSDIQQLSQKYFGKKITLDNLEEKIENDNIYIETPTGFGIVNYELNNTKKLKNNKYSLNIKYIEKYGDEEIVSNYILTVSYEDGNIIYETLEKAN